jgi:trans-2,3-dihydro-3-hydroxyanthranilate isomerase
METEQADTDVHSRMFAPTLGVMEDPATGGASGPLGCYLVKHGLVPRSDTVRLVNEQGLEMGRPSFIHIGIDQRDGVIERVLVGGQTVFLGEGTLCLGD